MVLTWQAPVVSYKDTWAPISIQKNTAKESQPQTILAQAGIKIVGRNINDLRYADDTTLMAESEEELKSLLLKVRVGLKLNIQNTKIRASGPITSWQIDGETVMTLLYWAPKSLQVVSAAMKLKNTCSLEEKLWPTWRTY